MKRALICLSLAVAALLPPLNAHAQGQSTKHITLMVPYAAGGPADVVARLIGSPLGQELGQPVIVDNLGGAGGVLGAQKVLAEPADGRFLLQASPNEVVLAPAINPAVKLRAEDFILLRPIVQGLLVMLVNKDIPVHNMDELIAFARKRPERPLSYGSVGVGTINHLIMEEVQRQTGTRFVHVPYKGSPPLLQDLGGGQIDVAVLVYGGGAAGMVDKGMMKLIGQFGAQRSPLLPQVPAVNESQVLPRMSFMTWSGVMARKGIPDAAAQRLNRALATVMQSPSLRETLAVQFLEPVAPTSLEEAAKFFQSEVQNNRAMLAGIDVKTQ